MKKLLLFQFALIGLLFIINAQTYNGSKYKTFGVSNASDNVVAIAPLSSGCATTGIYINNPFPIDGGTNLPNNGQQDIFVLTHGKDLGNPLSAFSIGGSAADISTDLESNSNDQLYLSGSFIGSTDFEYLNSSNALTATSRLQFQTDF